MMSQLHHEGLRKQMIADKKATAADFSWLKANSSQDKRNSTSSSRGVYKPSTGHISYIGNSAAHSSHSSRPRRKEIVITDPYLEAIVKESRARNRKRFTIISCNGENRTFQLEEKRRETKEANMIINALTCRERKYVFSEQVDET